MASWIDLSQRIDDGVATVERLHVETAYHGGRVPRWLAEPLDAAAANAEGRIPVTVVNVKHNSVDGALVAMSLVDLERLVGGAG